MRIRRYGTRRYFNVESQAWTNLEELAAAVSRGETLEAVDPRTGEDLSSAVLASILVWEAKQGRPRSPAGLHALIRERPIRRPAQTKPRDKLDALIEKLGAAKSNTGRR